MNNMDYMGKIKIKKKFKNNIIEFPMENEIVSEKVIDINGDDKYLFDINRKQAISIRCTYQNRYNTNIQLLRLDINSKPHRNPDMKLISESHIHVYTEEYKDTFAFELNDPFLNKINPTFDLNKFKTGNLQELFVAFAEFCHIEDIPAFNSILE